MVRKSLPPSFAALRSAYPEIFVIVSPPRSNSTAFARVFWEQPSVRFYAHEPFEVTYYRERDLSEVAEKPELASNRRVRVVLAIDADPDANLAAALGIANARAMAAGISMATMPTMAGLVVALSGLFFSSQLQHRAGLERQRAAELLYASEGRQ